MTTLHEYLTEYSETLQTLLQQHKKQEAILQQLEEKYGEDDPRLTWLQDMLTQQNTGKKGFADKEKNRGEKPGGNKPVHKQPLDSDDK